MTKAYYGEKICDGILAGKTLARIGREIGISEIYVRKITHWLVTEGLLIHHKPPYTVRAGYKEKLNNEKVTQN